MDMPSIENIILVIVVPSVILLAPKVYDWIKVKGAERRANAQQAEELRLKSVQQAEEIKLRDTSVAIDFLKGALADAKVDTGKLLEELRKGDDESATCRAENALMKGQIEDMKARMATLEGITVK